LLGGTGVVPDSFKDWFVSKGYSSDNIVRLGGATREGTAQQIVQELSVEAGTPVIIASEENFPDALSISSIASYKGYPVLLTRHDSLPDYVKTYLSTEKPSKVYIIGGTGAISSDVAAAVQNSAGLSSSSVIRLAGSSRYETSLAIAKEFDLGSKNITLVNGNDYPDAISGSVLSAKYQSPIILTDNNTSLTSIKSFVNSKGITNIYTLGGTGVLPDSSVNKLK
jgi:putative cell wall-binding protein